MVFDILITIMSLCLIGVMGGLLHTFCAILGRKEVAQARVFGHPLPPAGDNEAFWYYNELYDSMKSGY
jgi:hypothetical protein